METVGAWWQVRVCAAVAAGALLFGCSPDDPAEPFASNGAPLSATTLRTYDFESLSDWSAVFSTPTLSLSSTRVQGSFSLSVAGGGWSSVRSRDLAKEDVAPAVVGFDLRIPSPQPNPGWFGTVLLFVSIPSQGIQEVQLGNHDLINWTPGQWRRAEFTLPQSVRNALNANFANDLSWRIELNRPTNATAGYRFDRFTFGPCVPENDNNACTTDTCNAQGQQIHTPVAAGTTCSDGNACNGAEICNATGQCLAGTPVVCTASDQCHNAGTCDTSTGVCTNPSKPNGTACTDGDACTQPDTCQSGSCSSGAPVSVDDGNPCTADACNSTTGVTHTLLPAGTSCADQDPWNGAETCDAAGQCQPGTPVTCIPTGTRDTAAGSQEECDDGIGSEPDLCTETCRVTDTLAVRGAAQGARRYLGESRHPVSAGPHGFGVAFVEPDSSPPEVGLAVFDTAGDPRARLALGEGSTPVLFSSPTVAALDDGSFAVAWTDFGRDGDGLGVALRRVRPASVSGSTPPVSGADLGATLSAVQFVSGSPAFSQYDPDILRVGDSLIVAWADTSNSVTAPDIRYRKFDIGSSGAQSTFPAVGAAQYLSLGEEFEGGVALAPFGETWLAAWRRSRDDGEEMIQVSMPSEGFAWLIGPHPPGAAEDRPAVVELDATHIGVLYSVGTDPEGTGDANVPRLRFAVLTLGAFDPVVFDFLPDDEAYADPAVGQSHPSLVRAGGVFYAAWRSASLFGDSQGENVFLRELSWNGALVAAPEYRIPRAPSASSSDQRFPALAVGPPSIGTPALPNPAPEGALVVAWDDYGQELGAIQGRPDVLVQFWPLPLLRLGVSP
jgi:hypothetical protein